MLRRTKPSYTLTMRNCYAVELKAAWRRSRGTNDTQLTGVYASAASFWALDLQPIQPAGTDMKERYGRVSGA